MTSSTHERRDTPRGKQGQHNDNVTSAVTPTMMGTSTSTSSNTTTAAIRVPTAVPVDISSSGLTTTAAAAEEFIIMASASVSDSPTTKGNNNNHNNNAMLHSFSTFRLSRFIDQLTIQTNISKYIELPCLAVMGDTSSGKSALLSNLSGVELPSSHQLTTKCPILLQMTPVYESLNGSNNNFRAVEMMSSPPQQQQQQARIHIQWKSSFPNHKAPPPVFPERVITESEWSTLPDVLREAQDFILQHTGKQVAPDTIVLQVTIRQSASMNHSHGNRIPNTSTEATASIPPPPRHIMPPLTLLDLPGFVKSRAREDESESLIAETQQLLQEYLHEHPRCVILAVIPANVDIHNSQILAHIQQQQQQQQHATEDGATSMSTATIPVLTKPDLIDAGAEQDVLDLLLGKKLTVSPHGFHMVKGRGQALLDKGMSIEEGLEDEETFFDTVEPWKSVADRSLLGTRMLRQKLADIQQQMIQTSIPSILNHIQTQQQECSRQVEAMGRVLVSIAEKRRYYQDLVQLFMTQLRSSLSGKVTMAVAAPSPKNYQRLLSSTSISSSSSTPTVAATGAEASTPRARITSAAAQLHEACGEFMELIRHGSLGTIKTIVEGAQVLVTSPKGEIRGQVVHLEETFACVDFVDEKDHIVDVLFDYVGYQSQETLEEDDVWSDGKKVYIARSDNRFDMLKKIPLDRIRTDPFWLREKIAENRTDELPCFLNVDIFKNIIHEFIEEDWKPHCEALVERTSSIVLTTINESLQHTLEIKSCERYPQLKLRLQTQCQDAAMRLIQEAREQLHAHLQLEKHPYTQDFVLFENIAQARYRGLKRQLEVSLRLDEKPGEGRSGGNSGCVYDSAAIQTIIDSVFERNQKKSVEDTMAEEMEIVLEAYGKVATQRVIDRTPMICWQIFRSLTPAIQDTLWNATDNELEVAMQENAAFAKRYEELKEELDEMNKAMEIFQSLQ